MRRAEEPIRSCSELRGAQVSRSKYTLSGVLGGNSGNLEQTDCRETAPNKVSSRAEGMKVEEGRPKPDAIT
jgi:hypothetical protein